MRRGLGVIASLLLLGIIFVAGYLTSSYVYNPTLQEMKSSYESIHKKYENLSKKYQDLLEKFNDTSRKYESLKQEYERLSNVYINVRANYDSVNKNYQNLQNDYNKLKSDYDSLLKQYQELQDNYTKLESDYNKLQSDYQQLQLDYQLLQATCNSTSSEAEYWKSQYETLLDEFNEFKDKYGEFRYQVGILTERFNNPWKYVLTEDDPTVLNKYKEIVGHGFDPNTWYDDLKNIVDYIVKSVIPHNDPHVPAFSLEFYNKDGTHTASIEDLEDDNYRKVRYITDDYYYVEVGFYNLPKGVNDYVLFPSDTLVIGGDCDDISTLISEVWEGYCGSHCAENDTGVVFVSMPAGGHVAAYIKVNVNGQYKWVIGDNMNVVSDPADSLEQAFYSYASKLCVYSGSGAAIRLVGYANENEVNYSTKYSYTCP